MRNGPRTWLLTEDKTRTDQVRKEEAGPREDVPGLSVHLEHHKVKGQFSAKIEMKLFPRSAKLELLTQVASPPYACFFHAGCFFIQDSATTNKTFSK